MARVSRKDELMDVAEALYAERGVENVSLREINAEANCSPAALHYHFKNKEALLLAMLQRKLPDMLIKQFDLMMGLSEGRSPLTLQNLIDALVEPIVDSIYADVNGYRYIRFLGRLYLERADNYVDFIDEIWALVYPFLQALIPELDEKALKIRWIFCMDLIMHTFSKIESIHLRADTSQAYKVEKTEIFDTLREFLRGAFEGPRKVQAVVTAPPKMDILDYKNSKLAKLLLQSER